MENNEFNELAEMLFGLAGNFGDTIDEYTVKMWLRCFEADGITVEQIREAAIKIMQNVEFPKMPTYAQFRKYILGSEKDNAHAQVDIILDILRRNGGTIEPKFEDPVTDHLMKTRWKWKQWASTVLEDEIKWWRKEFIEAYQSYAANSGKIEEVQKLTAPQKLRKLTNNIGNEAST